MTDAAQGLIAILEGWEPTDPTRFDMRLLAVAVSRFYEEFSALEVSLAGAVDELDDWVSADARFEKGRTEREQIVTRLSLEIPELIEKLYALRLAL